MFVVGNPPNFKDEMIDALPTLKDRLLKGDPNILFSVINDLSKVRIVLCIKRSVEHEYVERLCHEVR